MTIINCPKLLYRSGDDNNRCEGGGLGKTKGDYATGLRGRVLGQKKIFASRTEICGIRLRVQATESLNYGLLKLLTVGSCKMIGFWIRGDAQMN